MAAEYAIWGVPPGATEETLLKSLITSKEELDYWLDFVKEKGCTKVRTQTLDLSQPFDAGQAFAAAVGGQE